MNAFNQKDIRILLVGGGTGGHFYPLIALAEQLNKSPQPPKLYYAGPDMYDAGALVHEGITFMKIGAGKHRRYASFLNFLDIFRVFFGFLTALWKLFVLYPDVVVSKGGYTSVPVVLAAAFLRIPILVHESDSVMGRANKVAARFARIIITSYNEVRMPKTKAEVVELGIPIRSSLLTTPSPDTITSFGIDPDRPVVLVVGGSQGAERINELILDSLDELLPNYTIIHQTGKNNFELCSLSAKTLISDPALHEHYHPLPFLSSTELNNAYHIAHVVISRAGSTSLYEIALHGKPSIIIPIPEEISHDQRSNAYAYARSGAAAVMEEANLTDSLLVAEIERIMNNDDVYQNMVTSARTFGRPDAAERMSTLILETAQQH